MESYLDLTRLTLGLGDDWKIERVLLDEQKQRVDIYISHLGGALVCPETGETGTLYDHRKERTWRHLDCYEFKCFVHCRVPRIKSSAGVRTIKTPWASASNRYTDAFERWTINLLQATKNQTKTAQLLSGKFDTVNRILHRSVARGMKRRSLDAIAHVSIDEKAFQRGHSYATIVSDSARGVVIDIGEGRDKVSTKVLLNRLLAAEKGVVTTITTDMRKAYITTVQELFPKARLIHDHFHLIRYLNKGIDHVRGREVKPHKELKYSRYVLLKNEQNRTQKQDEIFKVIQEANLQVSVAWRLREEFKAIFGRKTLSDAKQYFQRWFESVKEAAVKKIMKVAQMFERRLTGVCNAICQEQSNARAERINGKIQAVKTIGRGYRKFENFRSAILFFCGDLYLYPQYSR